MKALNRILLSTLFLLFGITSVNAQIAAAEVVLVGQDSVKVFPNSYPTIGAMMIEINPYFEVRDGKGGKMDGFQITGGDIYALNGTTRLKIGSITENFQFDEDSKSYFETKENIKIEVLLTVKSTKEKEPLTMKYSFILNLGEPSLFFGKISSGVNPVTLKEVQQAGKVEVYLAESPKLFEYSVFGGIVAVQGIKLTGKILDNGLLDANAKTILAQSAGKQVTLMANYIDPLTKEKKRIKLFFTVSD